jgi:hypothetical protein
VAFAFGFFMLSDPLLASIRGSSRPGGSAFGLNHKPRKRLEFKAPREMFHTSINRVAVRTSIRKPKPSQKDFLAGFLA